jgi:predicted amidohydrolase
MTALLNIVLAQVETTPNPAANLKKAESLAHRAAEMGADLVVFPEMYMGLPKRERPPTVIAAEDDGAFVRGLASLAADTGLFLACGGWAPNPAGPRAHNTVWVLSPAGQTVAAYRKLHLFDALNLCESELMAPGDAPSPVVEIAGVRVGLAICYDLRFPELFRDLAKRGAQLVLVPAAWYHGLMKETHWLTLLQARAIENTFYVAGCCLVGSPFSGRSAVFDPFGVPLGDGGEAETLVKAEINLQRLAAVRRKLPALQHRRLDLFPG